MPTPNRRPHAPVAAPQAPHQDGPEGHRRSIRLGGYDYASEGAYFVTICVQDRACLLGTIRQGQLRLSPAGSMVLAEWDALATHHPGLVTDRVVVMPNHIHGLILLAGQHAQAHLVDARGRPISSDVQADQCPEPETAARPAREAQFRPASLSTILGAWKSRTTVHYLRGVTALGWPRVRQRLWQRNYFEHIVRDDAELDAIRSYIQTNPERWCVDRENPTPGI